VAAVGALAQRLDHSVDGDEALVGALGQHAHDRVVEPGGHVGAPLLRGDRLFFHVPGQHVEHLAADEGRLAGQGLVGDAAERVDVGPAIERVAAGLLRRHVVRVAEGHAQAGRRRLALLLDQLGQPEVEQLDERARALAAPVGQKDVARAQVAVDVAHRVRLHERLAQLDQHVDGAIDLELALALDHVGQRLALEQLHGQVQPAVAGAPEVEDLDDVLVLDLADRGRLAAEALDGQVVAAELVVQHLDRDLAPQGDVLGAIDGAGAAVAHAVEQDVALADGHADHRIGGVLLHPRGAAVRAEQGIAGVLEAALATDDLRRCGAHRGPTIADPPRNARRSTVRCQF
jgi:hypothetical protein